MAKFERSLEREKKKKEAEHVKEEGADVGKALLSAEEFINKHKNTILYIIAGILVVVAGWFAYTKFISEPKEREAKGQVFQAEQYFGVDSFSYALNGDGNALGFKDIADRYSSTKTGKLANYYAGVSEYHLGNYEQAISYLKKYDSGDQLVSAKALCLIGDAYTQLKNYDEAVSYFLKAADYKKNNLSADYLMKAAAIYKEQGKYADALKQYERVKKEFPKTQYARDIDKYIARVQVLQNSTKN